MLNCCISRKCDICYALYDGFQCKVRMVFRCHTFKVRFGRVLCPFCEPISLRKHSTMRLYYQSPLPQRPPMQRSVPSVYRTDTMRNEYIHYQNQTVTPYDHNPHYFHQHAPPFYGSHHVHNHHSAASYAHIPPPPLPPPPIQRTRTPPPPHVIYVHPSSPSHIVKKSLEPHVSEYIYEVRENDVLCGRGAPSQYQAGNKFFRDIVERFQSSYIAARRIDKPEIATHIVDMVRERGGRFLKRIKVQGVGPSGHFCWQDIGDQRAYEKACQALREGQPEVRRKIAAKEIAAAALCSITNTVYPMHQQHLHRSPISHDTSPSDERRDEMSQHKSMDDMRCNRE